jgi:hypothetical protein
MHTPNALIGLPLDAESSPGALCRASAKSGLHRACFWASADSVVSDEVA